MCDRMAAEGHAGKKSCIAGIMKDVRRTDEVGKRFRRDCQDEAG